MQSLVRVLTQRVRLLGPLGLLALVPLVACHRGRDAEAPSVEAPPPAPAKPASGPSILAIPCTSDLFCGVNRCDPGTQRCAFPCASSGDCASGFSCVGAGTVAALCVPNVIPTATPAR